jgi:Fusaric acid resistance protein-like
MTSKSEGDSTLTAALLYPWWQAGRLVPLFMDTSGESMTSTQQNPPDGDRLSKAGVRTDARGGALSAIAQWLERIERIDPGTHRRIKGLRLVTAYGIAAMLGALPAISHGLQGAWALSLLAGNFALWGSVSEGRTIRRDSSRDLALLCGAAVLGAAVMIGLAPLLAGRGRPGPELTLVTGAFLVGYLKRYGVLGAGIGSQFYIGQLMAYMTRLTTADLTTVGVAGLLAAVASIIPRLLSGPAEHPAVALAVTPPEDEMPALFMGMQAAVAAVVLVGLNDAIGLRESAWAISASTYVIASSTAGTVERILRRIVGTVVGVPLGLAFLPLAIRAPLLLWMAAAVAMIIYAMALPERYDIACAAYSFTLVVTLAATGDHSWVLLAARAWETLLGGALGLVAAKLVVPGGFLHFSR